jgi:hypothetical protein
VVGESAGGKELFAHDLLVVGAHLVAGGELVETVVPSVPVDGVGAEVAGVDAVIRRWLVQADEWIRRGPVSARLVALVDEDDGGLGFGEQGVDEGHPHGACADDEVVGFDVGHRLRR